MARIVDLSHEIEPGMPVYPGDEPMELVQTRWLEKDQHNNHQLRIGMHVGTHLDAPLHMLPSEQYVSKLPLTSLIGPGCVLDVRNQPLIQWQPNYDRQVPTGSIILLYTGHDQWYGSDRYFLDHPRVAPEFCEFLLAKRVKLLGMDLPSPDGPPFPVHKCLLSQGVYLLENLTNLNQLLDWPSFEVIVLPLRIRADGAPVRLSLGRCNAVREGERKWVQEVSS